MDIFGIDISEWQDSLDYDLCSERGVKFAILRAGFEYTMDKMFYEHYENAKKQNWHVGAYWYTYATNEDEARKEARTFLSLIGDMKFDMPLYIDIEDPSLAELGREQLNNNVRAFGEVMENAGYYFGVYSNVNWYKNIISGSELNQKYDWWIACWGDSYPDYVDFGVWQCSNNFEGNVRLDADYCYKDYPTIIREAHLNYLDDEPEPTPEPTPTPLYYSVGDRVLVKGVATEDSNGGGSETAPYTGNPDDPDDIRYITLIEPDAIRPYHISVGDKLGDGDRGWIKEDQIVSKI